MEKQWQGGTAPLVDDLGDGSHVPVVKLMGGAGDGGQANALTDAQLRAAAVPVSVGNFPATQPVSGPLTDAQLRATAVPVSGPVTDAQMAARAYALDGTDSTGVVQLVGGVGIRGWLSGIFSKLPTTLGQKTSAQSLSVVVASDQTQSTKDINGQGAVRYTTDTTAVTGTTYAQIVCLTSTTFSLLTRTNSTGSLVGVALPPGTLLIGPITAYTLSSGAVAAYV